MPTPMLASRALGSVALLLAIGCEWHGGGSHGTSQPAESRATEADGGCSPNLLLDPVQVANIPDLAQELSEAYCHPSQQACSQLPEPEPYTFDEGDYTISAPTRAQWLSYCQALVAADPSLCESIDASSEPNLRESCENFFADLADRNDDSPAFCLAQIGTVYHSADEVGNCLSLWVTPLYGHLTTAQCLAASPQSPVTQFDLDLYCCMTLPRPSTLTAGQPDQEQCLYQLAQTSMDQRVCLMIEDPYPSNPQSQPSCLASLSK